MSFNKIQTAKFHFVCTVNGQIDVGVSSEIRNRDSELTCVHRGVFRGGNADDPQTAGDPLAQRLHYVKRGGTGA